jgi:hypothetical protein
MTPPLPTPGWGRGESPTSRPKRKPCCCKHLYTFFLRVENPVIYWRKEKMAVKIFVKETIPVLSCRIYNKIILSLFSSGLTYTYSRRLGVFMYLINRYSALCTEGLGLTSNFNLLQKPLYIWSECYSHLTVYQDSFDF